jgi:serine/threonine protein phosphatase PrpC
MEVNSLSPEELVIFISTVSIAIAKDKSEEELNVLASVFSQIGDTLATIAAQREILEAANRGDSDNDDSTYNKVE